MYDLVTLIYCQISVWCSVEGISRSRAGSQFCV